MQYESQSGGGGSSEDVNTGIAMARASAQRGQPLDVLSIDRFVGEMDDVEASLTAAASVETVNVKKMPNAEADYHVYAVEWTPEALTFFVDGQSFFTCKNDGTGVDSWPFDAPQYLILNLAIGGAWGGQRGVDPNAFPQQYLIDYVRVYQRP